MGAVSCRRALLAACLAGCATTTSERGSDEPLERALTLEAPAEPRSDLSVPVDAPLGALMHHLHEVEAGWFETRTGGFESELTVDGLRVFGPIDGFDLRLSSYGPEGAAVPTVSVQPAFGACAPTIADRCISAVELDHGDVTEWWVGVASGVQQGFTVHRPPVAGSVVVLDIAIGGAAAAVDPDGRGAELLTDGGETFRYAELIAWDADGIELEAWMVEGQGGIEVHVETLGATFPVVVDPTVSYTGRLQGAYDIVANDGFGLALDGAGDFNGDGKLDLVVGAQTSDERFAYTGSVYILYGGGAASTSLSGNLLKDSSGDVVGLKLVDPDGHGGDWLGVSVAGVGDVNGDGYDDIIAGSYKESDKGTSAGAAFLLFGGSAPPTTLTSGVLYDADSKLVGYRFHAPDAAAGDYFGYASSAAGDFNGDGVGDFIIGSYGDDDKGSLSGSAYVFYGGESLPTTLTSGIMYDGSGTEVGRKLLAPDGAGGDRFGQAVRFAGDVNGDGTDDVVVGAQLAKGKGVETGAAYVFYGGAKLPTTHSSGKLLDGSSVEVGLKRWDPSGSKSDFFGNDIVGVGDVNGDGKDDVAVGAPGDDDAGSLAGSVSVFYGGAGQPTSYSSTAGTYLSGSTIVGRKFVLPDLTGGERSGFRIANAGDIDFDGRGDLAIGVYQSGLGGTRSGAVYVVHGDAPKLTSASGSKIYAGTTVVGTRYYRTGTSTDWGRRIVNAGDLNGDFIPDLVAGGGDKRTNIWVLDSKCTDADSDGDGICDALDCAPSDSGRYQGNTEIVDDGKDQDCDGVDACYADTDKDGYRTLTIIDSNDLDCTDPGEAVASTPSGDCDDADATIHPGASETVGDEVDQDCDSEEVCFVDDDGDGVRVSDTVTSPDLDCDDVGEASGTSPAGDCDDGDPSIYPGAAETPNDGIDQDCDSKDSCYTDADSDGYRTSTGTPGNDMDCVDPGEAPTSMPDGDCDDLDKARNPGATEAVADGVDQDCDGQETCFVDADGDSVRTTDTVLSGDEDCLDAGEALASADAGDCDDEDADTYPGATEVVGDEKDQSCDDEELCFVDADGDGWRTEGTVVSPDVNCDGAGEAAASMSPGDCDDASSSIHPGATELVGDGIDRDCDGGEICYVNADGDAYRTGTTVISLDPDCADSGEALGSLPDGDCDDRDSTRNPGAAEVTGDNIDQDCDGQEICYVDADGDDYRLADTLVSTDSTCGGPREADASVPDGDCNDADASVNPGADEVVADGIDQDCDGAETCFADLDDDGYRTVETVASVALDCTGEGAAPSSAAEGDCDDDDPTRNPGAAEIIGDHTDQDCNGEELCYVDADGDGHRVGDSVVSLDDSCDGVGEAGLEVPDGDCDDSDAGVNPDAQEIIADGTDQDCDGREICFVDADNDGHRLDDVTQTLSDDPDCDDPGEALSAAPGEDCDDADPDAYTGAEEILADGVDQDCDGAEICYVDADDDGYRVQSTLASADPSCEDSGEALGSEPSGDCDDSDPSVHPGAERMRGEEIDRDCNGIIDAEESGCGGCASGTGPLGAVPFVLGLLGLAARRRRGRGA